MKKTLAILACTVLAASLAGAEEVVSSNTVGYQKVQLANGYTMIGNGFQAVSGDNYLSVQDVKAEGLEGVDWTFETEVGDTLEIWNSKDQVYAKTLYYAGDVQTADMTANGAEAGTWFDMGTYETSDYEFQNGDAFWIISSKTGALVTIAGEVPTNALSVTISSGYNMIANPYPKAIPVNELFSITGLTGVDWTFETETGDTLEIWDPETQVYTKTLYYAGDVQTADMTANGAEAGTWFDMGEYGTANVEIPSCGAFWIVSSGAGTLTFK